MSMCWTIVFAFLLQSVHADHFYGASINFEPNLEIPNAARFNFKAGWNKNHANSPGCTTATIGQKNPRPVSKFESWLCDEGCDTPWKKLSSLDYKCTSVDDKTGWEQGEDSFDANFTGTIWPVEVSYRSLAWRPLSFGKSSKVNTTGGWSIAAWLDLRTRSDTNRPNSSPKSLTKPIYYVQVGCEGLIKFPVIDPDGDVIKCRFGNNEEECATTCDSFPSGNLDEDTCILTFNATEGKNFTIDGWYVISLVFEDYPREYITLGAGTPNMTTRSIHENLSRISIQFLLHVTNKSASCFNKPVFVSPTPWEEQRFSIPVNETFSLSVYSNSSDESNIYDITDMLKQGPYNMKISAKPTKLSSGSTYKSKITWTPEKTQAGEHVVCFTARDERDIFSDDRCITIAVGDKDDCAGNPCENGGTCFDLMNKFRCGCLVGSKGSNCEKIEVDNCVSNPCTNGGNCTNKLHDYTCSCPRLFDGKNCQKNATCSLAPCHNGGTCISDGNSYVCQCPDNYGGQDCQSECSRPASYMPYVMLVVGLVSGGLISFFTTMLVRKYMKKPNKIGSEVEQQPKTPQPNPEAEGTKDD